MDAYSTDTTDFAFCDLPPVLVIASSDAASARAEQCVRAAGLRIGASLGIEQAPGRLRQQARASAVWIELDRDCGEAMDVLLNDVNRDLRAERYAVVLSLTGELLDPVAARIDELAAEILVDGTDAQRLAALSTALAWRDRPLRAADVASDRSADRLRQLSEEVSRIASTLARLSAGPGAAAPVREPEPARDLPPLSADTVRHVIRARRLRARYFSEELFADPEWDMMLDLLQAEIAQLRVPVSSLCIAAAVPATTALRWLKTLVAQGLFIRRADPHDGRRVFVELAPDTSHALRRYFAEVGPASVV
jgi:DNA-binding MarR family transcriptional regulator